MKILAAADIHGDVNAAKKLAEKAEKEKAELVILAGDLTFFENSTEGLMKPFVEKGQKVFILPGNHESEATTKFLADKYGVLDIHGYSTYEGEIGFFGVGSGSLGIFMDSEEEIYEQLKKGFDKIKDLKKKIMITHFHPAYTKPAEIFPGSPAIRKAIESFKPDIAICSHIHEAEGIEEQIKDTRMIVVGKKGTVLDV